VKPKDSMGGIGVKEVIEVSQRDSDTPDLSKLRDDIKSWSKEISKMR
jgi:hypothetical protein